MGVKLIANDAREQMVQLCVSDHGSGSYDVTDAMNVTTGPRHIKSSTDMADRSIIYRNNNKAMRADCCVIGGASRGFGNEMQLKVFPDCNGTWTGGTDTALHFWDDIYFGVPYLRNFAAASSDSLTITDANQTGLDFSGDFWIAGWFRCDVLTGFDILCNKLGSIGNYGYYIVIEAGYAKLRVSHDGTAISTVVASTAISAGTDYFLFFYHDNGTEIGGSINAASFVTQAHTLGLNDTAEDFFIFQDAPTGTCTDGRAALWCCGTNIDAGPRAMATWLYNSGQGRQWHEWSDNQKAAFGLVSHWSMQENTGTDDAADDYGPNDLSVTGTPTVTQAVGVSYKSVADRFDRGVTNPAEVEEVLSKTEICGPKDRTGSPQDLVQFFPVRSAQFTKTNSEYLRRVVADTTGLTTNLSGSFTIGFWFNQDSSIALTAGIMGLSRGGGTTSWGVYNYNDYLSFETYTSAGFYFVRDSNPISTGTWYFGMVVVDRDADYIYLYKDNELVDSEAISASAVINTPSNAYYFTIGDYTTGLYFDGKIQNAFYMPHAITEDERNFLYNKGNGRHWQETIKYSGLRARIGSWWSLNEYEGTRGDAAQWGNHMSDRNTVLGTAPGVVPGDFGGGLHAGQEGFGLAVGAGLAGAYDEEIVAAYFGESLDLGDANFPVAERPARTTLQLGKKAWKVEKQTSLTFENLTKEQVDAFEAKDFNHPVFFYDETANYLYDKLWHCMVESYTVSPEFNDLYTLNVNIARLRHYEVAE